MKASYIVAGALLLSGLLLLNVLQSYRFELLDGRVETLHAEQERIVEDNKRTIADITALLSPTRIRRLAVEELGMRPADAQEIYRVEVKPRE
ncbi:MAG: hypothetical protein ACOC45_02225 [Alkalispirochaetaceae bacterium]